MSSKQRIAELAYRLWTERGRPHGSAEKDWLEAERQLESAAAPEPAGAERKSVVDESLEETFPASDPAGSHAPDVPPANAEDKWRAAGKPRKSTAKAPAKTAVKASAKTPAKTPSKTPVNNGGSSVSARKATPSRRASNPPVDETDDSPRTAPGDSGEG